MYMWVPKESERDIRSPGAETIGNCFTLSRILLRYQRTGAKTEQLGVCCQIRVLEPKVRSSATTRPCSNY